MKRFVIDTNVIISFVTDRNPGQQDLAADLFESAAQLKSEILCHQHVITEFVYVLDRVYHVPKQEIRMMLHDFMHMPGAEIIHDIDFKQVFSFWPDHIHDFGDAVVASTGSMYKNAVIATFDRTFAHQLDALKLKRHEFG